MKKMSLNEIPGEESGSLQESSEEELLALDMEVLTYELGVIKTNLAASKPNMAAIAEYKKKEEVISNYNQRSYGLAFKSLLHCRFILRG